MDSLQKLGDSIRRRIVNKSDTGSIELFAHENQIPKSTLSEFLNGKNDPRLSTLTKICAGLEIKLFELFSDPAFESLVAESAVKYTARSSGNARRASSRAVAKTNRVKGALPRKR